MMATKEKEEAAPLVKDVRAAQLAKLRDKILCAHTCIRDAAVEGLENARQAGEALIEAKRLLKHGEWLPFLKQCDVCESLTERTAQAYMHVARNWARLSLSNAQRVADLSFREALKTLAEFRKEDRENELRARQQPRLEAGKDAEPEDEPQADKPKSTRASIAETNARLEARRAQRDAFACRIIESGYKVEAQKVHPDKGGSTEDMQMLTEVRDALLRDTGRFFGLESALEEARA
jgi:hypothetical protein